MTKKFTVLFILFCFIFLSARYFYIQKDYNPCSKFDSEAAYLQVQCWEQVANKIVKKSGVNGAFKIFPKFLANDSKFGENCHEYTHQVGHYAYNYYWDYKNGKNINMPKEASSCGYGFYHGLMSGILAQGVNVNDAVMFCQHLQSKFGDEKQTVLGNCYHGIGHGIAPTNIDWGNPKSEIMTSIENCKLIGEKYRECVIAVFGDVSAKYVSEILSKEMPDYTKHSIEEFPNIYNVCKIFPEYLSECIPAFSSYGIDTTKKLSDLLTVIKVLNHQDSRTYAIQTIARTYSRKSNFDQNFSIINDCTNLLTKVEQDACLTGAISGKIETIKSGEESEVGASFCATNNLSENQKLECNQNLANLIKMYY